MFSHSSGRGTVLDMIMVIQPSRLKQGLYLLGMSMVVSAVTILFMVMPAAAIGRGYATDDTGLQTGMVAALSTEGSSKVERASQLNSQRVVGVVTTFNDSSVTVASGTAKVLVETEGEVDAYVSDMGGTVTQGSLLVLSSVKGVLMKAATGTGGITIGIAAGDFSTAEHSTYSIDENGKTKDIQIYKLKINLNHQGNSSGSTEDSPLSNIGRAIVGKNVGETRVVVALILFTIVLIAEGGIIYGAISASITALGRNPLARKVIRQEMVRVIIIALLVLMLGLGAVYGVLWI